MSQLENQFFKIACSSLYYEGGSKFKEIVGTDFPGYTFPSFETWYDKLMGGYC